MGTYTIACPTCQRDHIWFSGGPDQPCQFCKSTAANLRRYNGEPLDGTQRDGSIWLSSKQRWYQLTPRRAVDGDIYPPDYFQKFCGVRVPAQYHLRFSEWATNVRTVALLQRCASLEQQLDEQDKLESKLRIANNLTQAYTRAYGRRLKKICELEGVVKANNEFIELQAQRLRNARDQVEQVAKIVNMPSDRGRALDP